MESITEKGTRCLLAMQTEDLRNQISVMHIFFIHNIGVCVENIDRHSNF